MRLTNLSTDNLSNNLSLWLPTITIRLTGALRFKLLARLQLLSKELSRLQLASQLPQFLAQIRTRLSQQEIVDGPVIIIETLATSHTLCLLSACTEL